MLSTPLTKKEKLMGYTEVHLSILLFGLTGLFAKWTTLHALHLVLGRVAFSSVFIFLWMTLKKEPLGLRSKKDLWGLALLGGLLSLHWVTFFASIQLSNVAIGLLTFSSFPIFVALVSAGLEKRKPQGAELVFSLLVVVGILIVVPLNDITSSNFLGGMVGVFSGFTYSIFTIYNANYTKVYSGKKIALYEHGFAVIWLLPSLALVSFTPTAMDWGLLLLLGTVFTGWGHSLFINGLKATGAYMASMITMLEPIYSILLAAWLLGEPLTLSIGLGGALILGTVLMANVYQQKHP